MENHEKIMSILKRWISLDLPRPGLQMMPFQGDHIDCFICKVLRDFHCLSKEDEDICRKIFADFLPQGVNMLHFRDKLSLQNWAHLLQKQRSYQLKQDASAVFLEASIPDNLHHLEFPFESSHHFASAGAWWGFEETCLGQARL